MSNSKLVKHGYPVLVYLAAEPLSLSCYMRVFHNPGNQISIALLVPVPIHGTEEERTFVMQYDADNLRFHTTAFDPTTVHVPTERREKITRHAVPRLTTLTLSLINTCPIWCPRGQVIAPLDELGPAASFKDLVALAKATTIRLVFDSKWLHPDVRETVTRLVKAKQRLHGYPELGKHYAKLFELKDWTIFAPAPAPSIAVGPSLKRARSISSSTSPPVSKRTIPDDSPPSPTELASSPPVYAAPESEHDFQTKAISSVVERYLPGVLKQALSDVLKQVLPGLLPALFAIPSSYGESFDTDDSQPQPVKLTPLGDALVPHINTHIQTQLQTMHSRALSLTGDQRDKMVLEWQEILEDKKLELNELAEDAKEELNRQAGYALDKVREEGSEVASEVGEEVEELVRTRGLKAIRETMKRLLALEKNGLEELVRWEVAKQQTRTVVGSRCVVGLGRGRSRVGKGGYRGLGERWRLHLLAS